VFWTDPEYERRERVKKRDFARTVNLFGYEFDGKRTKSFLLFALFLWTAFSFTYAYVVIKYRQLERLYIQDQARMLVDRMDETDKSRKSD